MVGVMAGGDVKFGTAVLLWAGPALALPVVVIIAWTGGAVGVLGWLVDRRAARRWAAASRPLHRIFHALSARRGVPYGVALAAGGLYALLRQAGWLGGP
jgi:prepilin peptidase CpaA